jgi:ATP-dependent RNA helicase RhlB
LNFAELTLEPSLQSAIDKLGYAECTPIQAATIPTILDGKDLSGLAQTGTGKTAAFLIPLMERILRSRPAGEGLSEEQRAIIQKRAFPDWRSQNFILILVPTRELAEQVCENILKFSEFSGLRGVSVYGGTSYEKQKEGFRTGVEFVVATPGRLIDLYKEHVVDLKQVRAIVFDEADRMFDMGFKDDMKYILQRVPRERQFLVFSATLNFDVLNTAYQFGAEPVEVDVSRDQAKAENVKDEIFHVGQEDKPMYLLSILKKHNPKQVIVFSNFKMNVERIAAFLSSNGYPAMAISSLLSQAQRNRVIELFKSENEKNILVATDVAARGLDIKGVDLVVNYEMPQDAESYVHRIGRTGRAGLEGQAFSLVSDRDVESLSRIEDYLKHKLTIGWMEDTDLIRDFKPFPQESYSGFRPPRAEGGRPRGGRSEGRRGGRPERGERPSRGDRSESQQHGEGRPHHHRGQRPEGQRHEGRRHEGRSERGQHAQGERPQGQHRQRRHEGSLNGKHSHSRGPRHEGQRRGGHQKVHPKVAQKSFTQKVTGFFKKIFGS